MGQYVVDCPCCANSSSSSSSSSGCQAPSCTESLSPPQIPSSVVVSFSLSVNSDNTGDPSCLPPCTQDYEITLTWGGAVYAGVGDSASGACNTAGIFPHDVSLGLNVDPNGVCRWILAINLQLYDESDYCTSQFLGPICVAPDGSYTLNPDFSLNCPQSNTCNDVVTFGNVLVS